MVKDKTVFILTKHISKAPLESEWKLNVDFFLIKICLFCAKRFGGFSGVVAACADLTDLKDLFHPPTLELVSIHT